jgi:hypothetical protein
MSLWVTSRPAHDNSTDVLCPNHNLSISCVIETCNIDTPTEISEVFCKWSWGVYNLASLHWLFCFASLILAHSFQKARTARHVFYGRTFGRYPKNGEKDDMWYILLHQSMIRVLYSLLCSWLAPQCNKLHEHMNQGFQSIFKRGWGVYDASPSLAFFTDCSYAFNSKMQASPRMSSRVNSRPAQRTEKRSCVAVRCFLGSEKPGRLWMSCGALFSRYTKDRDEDIDARYGPCAWSMKYKFSHRLARFLLRSLLEFLSLKSSIWSVTCRFEVHRLYSSALGHAPCSGAIM